MKIFSKLQNCKIAKLQNFFKPFIAMMLAVFLLASCAKDSPNVENQIQKTQQNVETRGVFCDESQYCTTILTPTYFDRIIVMEGCSIRVKYWVTECYDDVRDTNFDNLI